MHNPVPRMNNLSREQQFARELARALGDEANHAGYLSYAQQYPEPFLRDVLSQTLAVPIEKIRKSRAALFSFLIYKYGAKHYKTNPRP